MALWLQKHNDKFFGWVILAEHSLCVLGAGFLCHVLRKVVHRVSSVWVRLNRSVHNNHTSPLRCKL